MKRTLLLSNAIFIYLLFSSPNTYAQIDSIYIDSLCRILKNEKINDTTRISITLRVVKKLYFYNQDKSIALLKEIDKIIAKGNVGQQIDQLHYFGGAYQYKGNIDSTEYYHSKILSTISKEKNKKRYARALANLGIVYRKKGHLEKAAGLYEEAYEIFVVEPDSFALGANRNSLGLIYDAQGNYKGAMKMYLEALDIFKSLDNQAVQSMVLNNIGRVYNTQKDYDKALHFYKSYLSISKEIKNQNGIATSTNNIGSVYIELQDLDSAEVYLQLSIDKKRELNRIPDQATSLNLLGKVKNIRGNYSEAIKLNKEALNIADKYERKRVIAFSLLELGRSHHHLEFFSKAITYFKKSLYLAKEMGDVKLLFDTNDALYQSYRKLDSKLALHYLEKTYEYHDSILNNKNTEAITAMRLENEFNKKELINQQRIIALEFQDKLQITRLTNQRIIIAGLACILFLLVYLFSQIFLQKNKIESQKNVILKSLNEKEILLREIHHRVKNNLQVISSLLGIQSRKIKDKDALDALKEGRTRVESMSLIHQNLYMKDNLTGIEMKPYFQKLVQNLFDTYNLSNDNILINSDIDNLNLDVDTVIPLGLVINELISNALKYAFPGNKGLINVSLKEKENLLYLEVNDNGIGMPNPTKVLENDSFGYDLIISLVDKLEGQIEISVDGGTHIHVVFKEYKKSA